MSPPKPIHVRCVSALRARARPKPPRNEISKSDQETRRSRSLKRETNREARGNRFFPPLAGSLGHHLSGDFVSVAPLRLSGTDLRSRKGLSGKGKMMRGRVPTAHALLPQTDCVRYTPLRGSPTKSVNHTAGLEPISRTRQDGALRSPDLRRLSRISGLFIRMAIWDGCSHDVNCIILRTWDEIEQDVKI